ncbi:PEP-utilizing enzyme [Georgenia sp. TF02-10]|uniref:PEP-utilizing enzyme n=1 Tax=Georgenia sp. TF02-10 TaxID=2917725 RepID=UPI001FA6D377|nr:PEP-utilizing enzyme [Georgenia sp. TF02-10]UNX53348.1 PEP-utilizing enzyme [Georgenia sp. TF02-10]
MQSEGELGLDGAPRDDVLGVLEAHVVVGQGHRLLRTVQRYTTVREEQARDLTLGWPLLRRCAHRLGDHLTTRGVIDQRTQLFFLTLEELTSALDGDPTPRAEAADSRRAAWEKQRRLVAPLTLGQPPRFIGDPIARAVNAARTHTPPEAAIIGQPASAGRATGPVRIITGPEDLAHFTTGDVLVARSTAPAWTPLFARAAAVVTDGGTLAAHASLVAREYGIPAVVGTGDATARLHDGQLVTVDGGAGTVEWA